MEFNYLGVFRYGLPSIRSFTGSKFSPNLADLCSSSFTVDTDNMAVVGSSQTPATVVPRGKPYQQKRIFKI